MNSKIKHYLDLCISHRAMRVVLLWMVTIRSCYFLGQYIGPFVKFSLLWGAAVLLKDFFTDRLFLRNRYRAALWLFLIAYALTTVVCYKVNFFRNLSILFYMVMNLMIFFSYDLKAEADAVRKEVRLLSNNLIYAVFVGQLVSLLIFVLNIRLQFTYVDGNSTVVQYVGMQGGRLWGFFTNPNSGATFALFSIMAMVVSFFTYTEEERARRAFTGRQVFFVVNFILQAVVFSLCNSRITWVCLVIYLFFAPFCALLFCCGKGVEFKKVFLKSAALALLLPLAFYGGDRISKSVMPNLVLSTDYFSQQLEEGLKDEIDGEVIENPDDGEEDPTVEREDYGSGALGGRQYLWAAGLKIAAHHPVLGVGAENVPYYANLYSVDPENPDKAPYLPGINGGLHNEYLQILASSGAAGFLLMAFVILGYFWRCFKYFKKTFKERRTDPLVVSLAGFLLICMLRALGETGLIYSLTAPAILFWSFMGYTLYYMEKENLGGREPFLSAVAYRLPSFKRK